MKSCYLLVVLGEGGPSRVLVDGLGDPDDLAVAVADGHAQQRLRLVARQLVDVIAEATVLEHRATMSAFIAQ